MKAVRLFVRNKYYVIVYNWNTYFSYSSFAGHIRRESGSQHIARLWPRVGERPQAEVADGGRDRGRPPQQPAGRRRQHLLRD